ncbi:MAG: phosphoglycolate phosphatase [Verrucomicrobiales bacterium]
MPAKQNTMPDFKAAIFDLDGTLLDTLEDLADSGNEMLETQGFPTHPTDAYRIFVGDGVRVLMERILPEEARVEPAISDCMAVYREIYARRWNAKTRPYDGIPEMLDELVARGLKLAVLSNKPHDATLQCITELIGGWPWEIILGMRDGVPKKPDPTGALEIAEHLGVSPASCLYVGDTSVDMQTANAAGFHAVGVLWGFRERAELEENGAKTLLDHPQQLLNLLG